MASESSKGKEKRKLARTDRSPQGVLQQHSFLTDPTEVKKMEKDLLDLMKDFNEGKLHAFGQAEIADKVRPNMKASMAVSVSYIITEDDMQEWPSHFTSSEYTLDKMDQVRESQESLAQLHFELDVEESHRKEHEEVGRNRNLERLMKDLEKLSSSIQNLHQNDPHP